MGLGASRREVLRLQHIQTAEALHGILSLATTYIGFYAQKDYKTENIQLQASLPTHAPVYARMSYHLATHLLRARTAFPHLALQQLQAALWYRRINAITASKDVLNDIPLEAGEDGVSSRF